MKTEIKFFLTKNNVFVFIFGVLALVAFFFVKSTQAGTLYCVVDTSCGAGSTTVFRMQSTSNSHAGTSAGSTYTNLVCCGGVTGLGTNCSGTYQLLGTLSGLNNAHFEDSLKTNYSSANDICLSVTSGAISSATSTSCAGYDTTVASYSGSSGTNVHVGSSAVYANKICATASAAGGYLYFVVKSPSETFPNLIPGTLVATSSILEVRTDNSSGFNITVLRQDADTTLDLNTDAAVNIPDKTAWAPGANCSTAGNASASTTEPNTLQFRTRQAGTDSVNFCSAWWGTNDTTANALFAGFPSTAQQIIYRSTSAVASTTSIVLYNLNAPSTQRTGAYSGNITYTAAVNP